MVVLMNNNNKKKNKAIYLSSFIIMLLLVLTILLKLNTMELQKKSTDIVNLSGTNEEKIEVLLNILEPSKKNISEYNSSKDKTLLLKAYELLKESQSIYGTLVFSNDKAPVFEVVYYEKITEEINNNIKINFNNEDSSYWEKLLKDLEFFYGFLEDESLQEGSDSKKTPYISDFLESKKYEEFKILDLKNLIEYYNIHK